MPWFTEYLGHLFSGVWDTLERGCPWESCHCPVLRHYAHTGTRSDSWAAASAAQHQNSASTHIRSAGLVSILCSLLFFIERRLRFVSYHQCDSVTFGWTRETGVNSVSRRPWAAFRLDKIPPPSQAGWERLNSLKARDSAETRFRGGGLRKQRFFFLHGI